MDLPPVVPSLSALAISTFLAILLQQFLQPKKDASEPPYVPMAVPYIGHLIGVMRKQADYYREMGTKCGHKVFSLAMPAGRMYIVNSPDYISSIQKVPRVLSFWFIEASVTKHLSGTSKEANDILMDNARGEKSNNSLVVDGMKATHAAMAGHQLEKLALDAIQRARREISTYKIGQEVELWDWVQHVFSLAISSSVYGPQNPYENEELERGLSTFSDYTLYFLSGLPPWLIAPKAYAAREAIGAQFEKYFANNGDAVGGSLIQARTKVLREYGISDRDIARYEVVNGFGILLNLLPTAFWTIYHVFSDFDLLQAVRDEAAQAGLSECEGAFPGSIEELEKLDRLPLTISVLKEALRVHASGASARMVMEDHMLDGKYLLKKDAFMMIPNKAASFDRSAWGETAQTFVADRFLKSTGEQRHHAAFRGFGGGVNACPGKGFSIKLITAVVASLALRYDVDVVGGRERWEDPGHDESSIAIVLARPARKMYVRFVLRREVDVE